MKPIIALVLTVIIFCTLNCKSDQKTIHLTVKNSNSFALEDAYIEFQLDTPEKNFVINDGAESIPYQIVTGESNQKTVCLAVDLKANEEKVFSIVFGDEIKNPEFMSRTYAELSMKPEDIYFDGRFRGNAFVNVTKIKVPSIHKDHDALFRYEGPGWESEKVGYRFYLDWRNAIDIFGKNRDQLILANVGIHDTVAKDDSYHNMQEWGMDIFKVGNSLGIGSFGMWHDGKVIMVSITDSVYCEITENGPVRSQIKTNYYGWKVGAERFELESKLSITAGSRLSKNEITISDNALNIVTGLAKYPGTYFFKSDDTGDWSYIALYGNQTLASDNDKLGIAVFYQTKDLQELAEDDMSYVVKLRPMDGKLNYYFCAAWEQEQNAIQNLEEFKKYLNETQSLFNNPLEIKIE